jgi:hypothetical protein
MPSASFSGGFGDADVDNEPATATAANRAKSFLRIKQYWPIGNLGIEYRLNGIPVNRFYAASDSAPTIYEIKQVGFKKTYRRSVAIQYNEIQPRHHSASPSKFIPLKNDK